MTVVPLKIKFAVIYCVIRNGSLFSKRYMFHFQVLGTICKDLN